MTVGSDTGCKCGCKDCADTPKESGMWSSFLGLFGMGQTEAPVEESSAETKLTASQKITDLADWFNYPQREQFLFNSEINEHMNGSSNTVDHINPVEVQGSEDIMGAESFNFPFQQKNAESGNKKTRHWHKMGGYAFWAKWVATTLNVDSEGKLSKNNTNMFYTISKSNDKYQVYFHGPQGMTFDGQHPDVESAISRIENDGGAWRDNSGDAKIDGQTYKEYQEAIESDYQYPSLSRQMQREKDENKKPSETDYDYHARQLKVWEQKLKQGAAKEEAKPIIDYHRGQMAHYSNGEKSGAQGPQAPHQPGQVPMGGPNMFNTETIIWPQFTQNISGQGRTFANTIHPGMVIPNPDNYPTPEANNPWAPHVNIRTYGDILNAVYPPYPSAMEWATNPENYKEYPSTDWYTP
ncbi:MAG TPA: hypothetical protein EYF95_05370 [Flavobacteriales bacterium]|nr:hypothetical protein [Flavobacteriales bacterium]